MKFKAFALVLLLPTTAWATAARVDDVITKLQKSYESVRTIHAEFEQSYRSTRFGEKKNKGTVTVQKPGKMRWDYSEPKGKVLVANGKTIMMFDPEDQQVLSGPQPKKGSLPIGLTFLWGEGNLKDAFTITVLGEEKKGDDHFVTLHCIPKESVPNVTDLELVVKVGNPTLVITSRVIDSMGGINEIRFSDFKLNSEVLAKTFEFIPPPGAAVVPFGSIEEKSQQY